MSTIQQTEIAGPLTLNAHDIRAVIFDGLATIPSFAEAIDHTPRTVVTWIQQGLPVVYVGRKPHVMLGPGREWLLSRRHAKRRSPT